MLYVYAIATGGSALGRGQGGKGLRLVSLSPRSPMGAIVEDVATAPDVSAKTLRAHDAVVQRLLRRCEALLPARFGSTARDEADLRRLLDARASDFAAALGLVRGCVQMSIRVFGRAAANKTRAAAVAGKLDAGTRYLLEKAQEWKAAESMPEIEALRLRLAGLVRAERIERHATPGLVGTAHHLVDRERLTAYRARLRAATPALRPLRVHATGPWAPYAFAPQGLA